MSDRPNTLSKAERLSSRKLIGQLFSGGESLASYPVRLVWVEADLPANTPVQVAFSVSKKRFKRAVDRNRIKRQMREVYRVNKTPLYNVLSERDKSLALMVLYTGPQLPVFAELENKIMLTLQRLSTRYETTDR